MADAAKGKAKRTRTPAPKGETKAQRFIRLAPPRVKRAIRAIRSVAKLSARSYEATPDQTAKILETLRNELNAAAKAFESGTRGDDVSFTL